jgi:ubiquinone/menaquinone biosynthesis C-methylase UbiE
MTDITERVADPSAIWRVIHGFSAYFVTVAAVQLGIFDLVAAEPLDAQRLASACGADPARMATLCDALVALELLVRDHDAYASTPASETFLVTGGPRSMRELLLHSPGPWENWPALDATVRGATSPRPVDAGFHQQLVRATFPTQFAAASRTAELVGPVEHVLDLGAGGAPWTIALLRANPHAHAVVNDLAPVIEVARENVAQHDLTERCELLEGDYFAIPLRDAAFDVVVLGHVLRAEGLEAAHRLLRRAVDALEPGGLVLVADYFVDDDRRGPLNALLLGVTMMASTPSGSTYTYAEFKSLLAGAGADFVEVLRPVPFQEVMIGRKAGGRT